MIMKQTALHHGRFWSGIITILLSWHGLAPGKACSAEPSWWLLRGVIATDPTTSARLPSSDHAVINQGQLKNFVSAAVAELNANLPNGAGTPLTGLLAAWASPPAGAREDYAAVNIGQVKGVTSLIYDRLIAEGVVPVYPWTFSATAANDYALANQGQVKALLAFDLTGDVDHDGLDQSQEIAAGTNPWNSDTDGDGVVDGLDSAPLNPAQSLPAANPADVTSPVILLIKPADATPNP